MTARLVRPFTILAILLAASPLLLLAQSPEFEVASIKPNRSGSGGSNLPYLRNGTLTATNVSLRMLLEAAYDLSEARIVGPGWLDADRFDLSAKAPSGHADTEMMPMLQALLKARFGVSVHRETREMPILEMVVAKDGLKIARFDGTNPPKPGRIAGGSLRMGIVTMPQLAKLISSPAGRPVVDKTSQEGQFSYVLTYASLSAQSDNATEPQPDFFDAVQQQLGLKLEPKKGPVEVLVVDHAERAPIEN